MLPIAFSPTDPRCHGNEIWDKMGYNSVCVGDFCEIFAPIEGFSGMGPSNAANRIFPDRPRCHGNEIWDKIDYNSACVGDFCAIFAPIGGVFWDEPSNVDNCLINRPIPVAMATNFGTKWAITRLA